MTYEPVLDGPDGRTTAGPDAAATWPVLARLPWVGEVADMQEAPRASNADPLREMPGRREASQTANLRLTETPAETYRQYFDQPHMPAAPTSEPIAIAGSVADERKYREAAPQQRRHRIDAADARHAEALAATVRRHTLPINEQSTLAGQVFQWHAAATPYAGVMLTFLLAFAGGLLYWYALGRPHTASTAEAPGAPLWTSESLDPTSVARDSLNGAVVAQSAEEFSWSQRDEEQLLSSDVTKLETPPLSEPLTQSSQTPVAAALAPPKTGFAPTPVSAAPAIGVTPTPATPAASNFIYPTTPYPAIDAGLIPATTLSPSVAERPVDDAALQPVSR